MPQRSQCIAGLGSREGIAFLNSRAVKVRKHPRCGIQMVKYAHGFIPRLENEGLLFSSFNLNASL
jgi:hypothetical protein